MCIKHTYQAPLKNPDYLQGIEDLKSNELCFNFCTIITIFFEKTLYSLIWFCCFVVYHQFNNSTIGKNH